MTEILHKSTFNSNTKNYFNWKFLKKEMRSSHFDQIKSCDHLIAYLECLTKSQLLLFSQFMQYQKNVSNKKWVDIFISQKKIGDQVGVCRKTVNRFVNETHLIEQKGQKKNGKMTTNKYRVFSHIFKLWLLMERNGLLVFFEKGDADSIRHGIKMLKKLAKNAISVQAFCEQTKKIQDAKKKGLNKHLLTSLSSKCPTVFGQNVPAYEEVNKRTQNTKLLDGCSFSEGELLAYVRSKGDKARENILWYKKNKLPIKNEIGLFLFGITQLRNRQKT